MAWINLAIAGLLEVIWAISLKYSNGFSNIIPSIITVIGMILSYYFLAIAVKELPIGTAYTVWTGFGAIGTVILGILLFGEQATPTRILFLGLIIAGITGLKLT
ncbi:quaternary ammonium compound efflux SMR transporter SugE [bacterium]|nr:quaternary ammonium compound efflux SMR transporter SugE [bacterium]